MAAKYGYPSSAGALRAGKQSAENKKIAACIGKIDPMHAEPYRRACEIIAG